MAPCASYQSELARCAEQGFTPGAAILEHLRDCLDCQQKFDGLKHVVALHKLAAASLTAPSRPFEIADTWSAPTAESPRLSSSRWFPSLAGAAALIALLLTVIKFRSPTELPSEASRELIGPSVPATRSESPTTLNALRHQLAEDEILPMPTGPSLSHFKVRDAHANLN